jgi:hypothetical protein
MIDGSAGMEWVCSQDTRSTLLPVSGQGKRAGAGQILRRIVDKPEKDFILTFKIS